VKRRAGRKDGRAQHVGTAQPAAPAWPPASERIGAPAIQPTPLLPFACHFFCPPVTPSLHPPPIKSRPHKSF
jgi:hypothetical protein